MLIKKFEDFYMWADGLKKGVYMSLGNKGMDWFGKFQYTFKGNKYIFKNLFQTEELSKPGKWQMVL